MYEDSARRYRNKDDARVVEIDLQIIVDEYRKEVELLENIIAKNSHNLTSYSTFGLEKDIELVVHLLIKQSLVDNHYFKQLKALKDRADAIKAKLAGNER
jgi:hypothetical protein